MKKYLILTILMAITALVVFSVMGTAHTPRGKQTHSVGIETESCQDAYAGAEEQLADRGEVNSRLLANIEDKCGFEFDEKCTIEFDVAHEPVLVCEEECVEISPEEIHFGACTDFSAIDEIGIPQCCTTETPRGINCGEHQEWVVGIAAFLDCYISNS